MKYLMIAFCAIVMMVGCKKYLPDDCEPKTHDYLCKFKSEYYELLKKDNLRLCLWDELNIRYIDKKNSFECGDCWMAIYKVNDVDGFFMTKYLSENLRGDGQLCVENKVGDYPFSAVYLMPEKYDSVRLELIVKNDSVPLLFERVK